jgi:hypothetical protein
MTKEIYSIISRKAFFLALLLGSLAPTLAEVANSEKLLPADTLFIASVPEYAKFRAFSTNSPKAQLWGDPAMRPFREKFVAKWMEEFVKPLEQELQIQFDDYTQLPQGQLTLAVTLNGRGNDPDKEAGAILLVDVKDKSETLAKQLGELRKKWTSRQDKPIRTEKVGKYEFSIISLSTNDVPKTLRKFLPRRLDYHEIGEEAEQDKPSQNEVVVGQAESLLIIGDSLSVVEKVVSRLSGSAAPCLGDQADFQASQQAHFRDVQAYAWLNGKAIFDLVAREAAAVKENPQAPNPFELFKPAKLINASGLSGLRTLALSMNSSNDGTILSLLLGVPESDRSGLFKILAGEPKESNPPAFVPADALKFQRWRLDGQKAWSTVEKIITEISPQTLSGLNFLIETANTAAREKDPGFDLRKNLIGNLGDDMISYEKPPRSGTEAGSEPGASLFLIGSPNPETLAASLKMVLVFVTAQAGAPAEREFLGRKILSIPLPAMPLAAGVGAAGAPNLPRTLHYAPSGGYVAFSTDAAILEEYLRSSESQGKSLRDTAGLMEAAQKVGGPGSSLFGFENDSQVMRYLVEKLRKGPASANSLASLGTLSGAAGIAAPDADLRAWLDFSLLPEFDKIAKYFHFSVSGLSATTEGISYRIFFPTPPGLRSTSPAKP